MGVVDGKLYAIGGRLLGNGIPRPINEALSNFNDNEAYDPRQDSWTTDLPMPTSRLGLEAVSFENKIHVLGGKSNLGIVRANG
jgi:N-acetylneuraminic acid mutarotase